MARHTRLFATIAATALLSAGLVGHAGAQTIKIGVNEPLTGPFAASGTYVVNGAKIAADEINAKGGVLGQKIELIIEDNKSNPTEAAAVAEKLITADKVPVMMGAWGSSLTLAVMPKLMEYKVPMVVETSSSGQDYDKRQPLHLPHLAAICGRGSGLQDHPSQDDGEEGRFPCHQQ